MLALPLSPPAPGGLSLHGPAVTTIPELSPSSVALGVWRCAAHAHDGSLFSAPRTPHRSVQGEAALRRALESGALRPHNISQMNPEGWAPLHCAAAAGRVPEVGRRLTLMIL
jgi:hypothetical protein|eukprot:COSAG01_NODE_9875_length_2296_cov_1.689842_1_plen_112_part_00